MIKNQQNKLQDKAKRKQKDHLCVDERQFMPKTQVAADYNLCKHTINLLIQSLQKSAAQLEWGINLFLFPMT